MPELTDQERVGLLTGRLGLPDGSLDRELALQALRHGSYVHERSLAPSREVLASNEAPGIPRRCGPGLLDRAARLRSLSGRAEGESDPPARRAGARVAGRGSASSAWAICSCWAGGEQRSGGRENAARLADARSRPSSPPSCSRAGWRGPRRSSSACWPRCSRWEAARATRRRSCSSSSRAAAARRSTRCSPSPGRITPVPTKWRFASMPRRSAVAPAGARRRRSRRPRWRHWGPPRSSSGRCSTGRCLWRCTIRAGASRRRKRRDACAPALPEARGGARRQARRCRASRPSRSSTCSSGCASLPALRLPDYEGFGEAGVPGRLYFRKRGPVSFNAQVVEHSVPALARRAALPRLSARACGRSRALWRAQAGGDRVGRHHALRYLEEKAGAVEQILDRPPVGLVGRKEARPQPAE